METASLILNGSHNKMRNKVISIVENVPSETNRRSNKEITKDDNMDITEEEANKATKCLTFFKSSLFATILEETIMESRVLTQCNTELKIYKIMSEMKYLLTLKYGVKEPEKTDELEGIDPRNLNNEEYKIKKLDKDRKYAEEIYINLYLDLILRRNFDSLKLSIQKVLERNIYDATLIEDEAKNKLLIKDLRKKLRLLQINIKSTVYDADVNIDTLRALVEDASLNAEIRGRYVDNWQNARTEQHLQTIYDHESIPTKTIAYYKERSENEHRVHNEVELMVNIGISETLAKVEEWMDKYDKDMEGIDLKIQIQKNDYVNMMNKRINLEETIEKHDQMIKEWNHFKMEREKARQYRELMTKSAIIVQAWWRGLLVRRQLGPYKVSKKKKAKK